MTRLIKKQIHAVLAIAILTLAAFFVSCENIVGFGRIVDFEPPELFLNPGPDPMYMNRSTVIGGTVTDNSGVAKVICREDSDTGRTNILGTAVITGNTWTMTLNPDAVVKTGKNRILAILEAADTVGNWSDQKAVNMILDMRAPIFSNPVIQRTKERPPVSMRPLNELKALEISDPDLKNSKNVDLYQNGAFWIKVDLADEDTSIVREFTGLKIFDDNQGDEGDILYDEIAISGGSAYAPEWLIRESDLLTAADNRGLTKNGLSYGDYLKGGGRLYFRVSFTAEDKAQNEARDDFGYFCLCDTADTPRVGIDTWVGDSVSPGTPVPVTLFDDDYLDTAYVDMLTMGQWNALAGTTPKQKLINLEQMLNDPNVAQVWNWMNDQPRGDTSSKAKIVNRLENNPESTVVSVQAGLDDRDCGEYMIVAIVTDKKGAPHDMSDPESDPVTVYYSQKIVLIDNNAPLIVIDTVDTSKDYNSANHPGYENPVTGIPAAGTGNSPEENTPPNLTNHQYFTINGYTLDANSTDAGDYTTGRGLVVEFKIAWIPFGIEGGQDANVNAVKDAMTWEGDPDNVYPYPDGVQHWTLTDYEITQQQYTNQESYFIKGTDQVIGGTDYTKQTFKKKFDVLGGPDDLNNVTNKNNVKIDYGNNFEYKGERENGPKLFVLYAKDMDGHVTFRTIRLLGYNNPPKLNVYNFTGSKPALDNLKPEDSEATIYNMISSQVATSDDIMGSFKTFPRNTMLKLYAQAEGDGEIRLKSLKMYDITFGDAGTGSTDGIIYDPAGINPGVAYIARLEDVSQKVFLFKAVNELDEEVSIQRTVAVTTTAALESIITSVPSATYGIGKEIILRAHFAGTVKAEPGDKPGSVGNLPMLNIIYQARDTFNTVTGTYNTKIVYEQVPFSGEIDKPTMYLDFKWKVPEDAISTIKGIIIGTGDLAWEWDGRLLTADVTNDPDNKLGQIPIFLNGAYILDAERGGNAFLPGKTDDYGGSLWKDGENSLQGQPGDPKGTKILLDGVKPVIDSIIVGGKIAPDPNPDTGRPNHLYFKSNETITFVIMASKEIRPAGGGNPQIEFKLKDPLTGLRLQPETSYYAKYDRPAGNSGMFFQIDVNSIKDPVTNLPLDGVIEMIGINKTSGIIEDMVMNELNSDNLDDLYGSHICNAETVCQPADRLKIMVAIDQTPPPDVNPVLYKNSVSGSNKWDWAAGTNKLNFNPILKMDSEADKNDEPWGCNTEYSLNNGLSWEDSAAIRDKWTVLDAQNNLRIVDGQFKLRVRRIDLAGNESTPSGTYDLDIKGVFPKLVSISAVEPDGKKLQGPITINLDFTDTVYTTAGSNAYIKVTNIIKKPASPPYEITGTDLANATDETLSYTAKIPVLKQTNRSNATSTLTFLWDPITEKLMDMGLMVSDINLDGVLDLYGNTGDSYSTTKVISYDEVLKPGNIISYNPDKIWVKDSAAAADGEYGVTNLNGAGLKIYTIRPKVINMVPQNANDPSLTNTAQVVLSTRNTITLTFDQNMRAEMGTIVIRPYTRSPYNNYPIPPVFPAESQTVNGTYIPSFFEVFSSPDLTSADREALLKGDTGYTGRGYEYPATDSRTGLYTGPYKLTTQGLVEGLGFAGDNTVNTTPTLTEAGGIGSYTGGKENGNPGWYPETGYMVPDTSSKYVLDYKYSITETSDVVNAIRNTLNKQKFRWQEIEVISTENVQFRGSGTDGRTKDIVDIILDTSLNEGMVWELYIPEGTFTNEAGNKSVQIGVPPPSNPADSNPADANAFYFWSSGVQTPVIRVDRKSMDQRATVNTVYDNTFIHATPPSDALGGVSITSFDTINFRIESETPDAIITYGTIRGIGSATGTGTGTGTATTTGPHRTYNNGGISASLTATDIIPGTSQNWNTFDNNRVTGLKINNIDFSTNPPTTGGTTTVNADPGTWILPNLLRKSITGRFVKASVDQNNYGLHFYTKENNYLVKHQGMGNLSLFRSYNRDITKEELEASTFITSFVPVPVNGQSSFSAANNNAIETRTASKNYIIAQASKNYPGHNDPFTSIGYEGVFKTVVALLNPNTANNAANDKPFLAPSGNGAIAIFGSNLANGSPSIAGFPILMGTGDLRYTRIMARDNGNTTRLIWMSTEIISPAFFAMAYPQSSGSLMAQPWTRFGDSGTYLTGGYGDLTYSVGQM
ncbi:MAG: hypothetical protein FWD78_10485 [Treponema sp.]|nr:hypothetical protein [Treponema sp.]